MIYNTSSCKFSSFIYLHCFLYRQSEEVVHYSIVSREAGEPSGIRLIYDKTVNSMVHEIILELQCPTEDAEISEKPTKK